MVCSISIFFTFSKLLNPVPAGINRPMITFSFNPFNQSLFPSIAASVKTRVVSWKLAAEIKLSLFKEAFVRPNNTGLYISGSLVVGIEDFVKSFFDYTSNQFPKGETAVLTSVEKKFGDSDVSTAQETIKDLMANKDPEIAKIKKLAGVQ